MYSGPKTYDDPCALVGSRDQMRRVTFAYAAVCAVVIAVGAPLVLALGANPWIPLSLCVLLSVVAVRSIRRLGHLQQRLWRVAVSARHLTLLNVSQRQRTVGWRSVTRVEVSDDGLVVVARRENDVEVRLCIAASFGPYVDVSHHLVELAERWGRPIWIDGRPLARLDLRALLSALHPGLSAGSTG